MRSILRTIAAVAFGLVGVAAAHAQHTIKVAVVTDPGFNAALWAAMNGKVTNPNVKLQVDMMPIPELIQAAMTKQYDILPNGVAAVVQMKNAGLDVKILGTEIRLDPAGHSEDLWVRKNSNIKTAADLKGKRVAVTSIEAQNVISIRAVLKTKYGLNPSSIGGDIKWVQIPASQFQAALDSGQVDAVAFSNVLAYKMAQTGDYRSVLHGSEDLAKMFGGPMPTVVEIAYTDRLKAHPKLYEAAEKLIRASAQYALSHQNEVFSDVAPKYNMTVGELKGYFTSYASMPMALNHTDASVIEKSWKAFKDLGSMSNAPSSAKPFIWDHAIYE